MSCHLGGTWGQAAATTALSAPPAAQRRRKSGGEARWPCGTLHPIFPSTGTKLRRNGQPCCTHWLHSAAWGPGSWPILLQPTLPSPTAFPPPVVLAEPFHFHLHDRFRRNTQQITIFHLHSIIVIFFHVLSIGTWSVTRMNPRFLVFQSGAALFNWTNHCSSVSKSVVFFAKY